MKRLLMFGCLFLFGCGAHHEPSTTGLQSYFPGTHFPDSPDPALTPGSTCADPDRYRFPERIKYCERRVPTPKKNSIIEEYDDEFGYMISRMNRRDFKVDHYISLCVGGSNNRDNLWPQHRSLFVETDPIEHMLCQLLSNAKVSQQFAIETMKSSKHCLEEAREIRIELEAMVEELL